MVPLNPNLKIFKKAVIERVKWFGLLFLNLVPLNTQNEINTKNTSESPVIKQISQLTLLVIEKKWKKWKCKAKGLGEVGEVCHFFINSETKFPLITFI